MKAPPTERFDRALRDKAKAEFTALVERLALGRCRGFSSEAIAIFARTEDPEGRKLYSQWKAQDLLEKQEELLRKQSAAGIEGSSFGNAVAEFFVNVSVPVKSPRHCALVGLPYTVSDEEFKRAWIAFERNSAQSDFERETQRLQAAGHSYQEAWQIAGLTEPGKSHFRRFKAAADAEKQLSTRGK